MEINEGDLFWLALPDAEGTGAGIAHPHVVIQSHSESATVTLCAVTTNARRATWPGMVRIPAGEGNLPKASIVVVSRVVTVERAMLGAYIGTLSPTRVGEILAGMRLVQRMQVRHGSEHGN